MRTKFEARFKTVEDEHALLTQLTSIKKQPTMSMRDFVAKFNKINSKIPTVDRPTAGNLKTFFISAMPPYINYDLRRGCSKISMYLTRRRTRIISERGLILCLFSTGKNFV
jgi:hypothetical protein